MIRLRLPMVILSLLTSSACMAASPALLSQRPAPLSLIPMPAMVTSSPGYFELHQGASLVVRSNNEKALAIARQFAALLARTRGIHLDVRTSKDGSTARHEVAFDLEHDDPSIPSGEGYRLTVDSHGIRVVAGDPQGLFYGSMTLWQLLTPHTSQSPTARVASVEIDDKPRFQWRGLMLDSARHMQSVAQVERLLQQMAEHKLNVFHWHLTDDQGWRIQIKRYPKLASIGAWRTPPDAGHDGEPRRYGGFYTQDQIRQVVAYAAARYITVVPELDMPGHAQAVVAAYPQFGVTGKRPKVTVDWGINPYLYNVNDATFAFIDNVLDEVMALFPSHYIDVGGDEAIKDQWKASAAIQAKMHALGLKNEDALQGWFINRVGKYLEAHGRQLIGWDEILDGGVPARAAVMSWRGIDGAVKAAKEGHDVVLSPSSTLYLDSVQSDRADEASGRLPVHDLAGVYAFEPVPKELDVAQAKHVLGAQVNVWTEHLPTMQHVEHAVFPRLDALSEVDWSPAAARNWSSFLQRLPAQFARYRAQHITYADGAFAADISFDRNAALSSVKAKVSLTDQVAYGQFRYTVDGSKPTLHSSLYQAPFTVSLPTTLRVATFAADGGELAAPRQQLIDHASVLSVSGTLMPNCPGNTFRLRVQPTPDARSMAPVYAVNVFNSCQMFPVTRLDGATSIHVDAVRLARNYALAHDLIKVVSYPHRTPFGELLVHQDRCDGPLLASMPLPDPAGGLGQFTLNARLPAVAGEHALCLLYTAPTDGPLYALGEVSLRDGRK